MHLKLTYMRPQGRAVDLAITVDATALVGDVAAALLESDPAGGGGAAAEGMTLALEARHDGGGRTAVLDPRRNLVEAGVRSGSVVRVIRPQGRDADAVRGPATAVLRVVSGPDAGREFSLSAGVNRVGRLPSSDVRLTDPLVSKRHARIIVGEAIEIVDEGSSNGVIAGGRRLTRTLVGPSDLLQLGDTAVAVSATTLAGTVEPTSSNIEYNRSPRVVARYEPRQFRTPVPPKRPEPARFPIVSMLAPLIMGAVLFAVTRSLLSIVFVGLSPLLMAGMYVDQRFAAKRKLRQEIADFDATVQELDAQIAEEHRLETAVRLARTPSLDEVRQAVLRLGPLLWSVRAETGEFLTVRLGVGSAPSVCEISEPEYDATNLPEYHRRAVDFRRARQDVHGVPIVGDLRSAGALGVAGPGGVVEPVARGLLFQLVALHSPADLAVAVFSSPSSRPTWDWVQWLPHAGGTTGPLGGVHLADNQGSGARLAAALEELIAERLDGLPALGAPRGEVPVERGIARHEDLPAPPLPSVVVVIDDDAPVDHARLVRLAEAGPDAGVHVLWVAAQPERLPGACRTHIVLGQGVDGATTGIVRHGLRSHPVRCEGLAADQAAAAALLLAPVVDASRLVEDSSDVPQSVSFLELTGTDLAEGGTAVLDRWTEDGSLVPRDAAGDVAVERSRARTQGGGLAAVVGSAGVAPMVLDLREHGPHALVGGTTGSGKSEFLQSWVLGMAAAHSPDRVTFLFIDYKGGAAFADCISLPHSVGLVTDLSPHLVRRALTSLRAELRYREHLLNRKKAKDLVSLEKTGDPECPPSLVIVVDEFAALVQEVPEFVDGVVDVAQRGRSLGLHLILATQRPAGVIKDNLRANTNLRIALRMADADDSVDVLGIPDAAEFPTRIPGRAAARTGPGRLTVFQSAYAGGHTSDTPTAPPIGIEEMHFGSPAPWDPPAHRVGDGREQGPSDITRVVASVRAAARSARIPQPRKPWLPELQETYDAADFVAGTVDTALVLGVGDDPSTQSRPLVRFEPDRDGNMAVYGTGGSGKSAALRQVAVAAALASATTPVHVYGLDFGSSGLRMLEALANVGAVIGADDEERIARLMQWLVSVIDERAVRYAEADASTITEYRANTGRSDEARILVLVDGVGAFREAFETSAHTPWFTMFTQIAGDGRGVGVHVVVTGDRPNAVPPSLSSSIQKRLVLRLAAEDDYMMLGVPRDVLGASSPPGRAIHGEDEMQFCVLGGDANIAVQARELGRLSTALQAMGVAPAPPIARLPDEVGLAALPPYYEQTAADGSAERYAVIGVESSSLGEVGIPLRGAFLLAGPPGSGRTTALTALAQAASRAQPDTKRVLLTARRSPSVPAGVFDRVAAGPDEAAEEARELLRAVRSGDPSDAGPAVFIEAITGFDGTAAAMDVADLVTAMADAGRFVVGESEGSAFSRAYSLIEPFKAARSGLLLVPDAMDGDILLNTQLGRFDRKDFPPGRGFLIRRGKAVKMQTALPMRT